jgi:prepilin-type N-terminal cleavage/methylation domain-containing protein
MTRHAKASTMASFTTQHRRGMTLVELLVVVAVIGLLAVAVAPVLQPRPQRRAFQDSADILAGILTEAGSKAIGKQRSSGVTIAAESVSGGISAFAAVHPRFSRTAASAAGLQAAITTVDTSVSPPRATITISPPLPTTPAAGALLEFTQQKTAFPLLTATTIEMADGYSLENGSFPYLSSGTPFLHNVEILAPPTPRMYAITPTLKGDSCIDLSCSSLGVEGYSTTVEHFSDPSSAPVQQLSVLFDTVGKPTVVWLWRTSGATKRIELLDSQPLALMVGSRLMAGTGFVATPTEDNPGWNYQNPNTFWVVLDPKAAAVRVIENNPSFSSNRATARAESQKFVADDLKQ